MEEFEGKIYVYGATNEDKYQEIQSRLKQIGCSNCKQKKHTQIKFIYLGFY